MVVSVKDAQEVLSLVVELVPQQLWGYLLSLTPLFAIFGSSNEFTIQFLLVVAHSTFFAFGRLELHSGADRSLGRQGTTKGIWFSVLPSVIFPLLMMSEFTWSPRVTVLLA